MRRSTRRRDSSRAAVSSTRRSRRRVIGPRARRPSTSVASAGDAAIREVLADGFCDKGQRQGVYGEIGTYVRGNELWVVLAAPRFTAPGRRGMQTWLPACSSSSTRRGSKSAVAGGGGFRATHALTLSATLTQAAAAHAADMAAQRLHGPPRDRRQRGRRARERAPATAGAPSARTWRRASRTPRPSWRRGSTAPGIARTSWARSSRNGSRVRRLRRRATCAFFGRRSSPRRAEGASTRVDHVPRMHFATATAATASMQP